MTEAGAEPVRCERRGGVGVAIIDNPPVNALSFPVRRALLDTLRRLAGDSAVEAIVIACAGPTFVAGADIAEFGTPKQLQSPTLPEICALLETIGKPTVAAIHGNALGGGLELSLACHFRVADRVAKLGLPEVKLGLIPGAGGTVRLPRLLGPEAALDMIASGEPVGAERALDAGLVDALADGDVTEAAVALARRQAEAENAPLPVSRRNEKLAAARRSPSGLDAAAAEAARKGRGLEAPLAAIEAIRNAVVLDADEALGRERATFLRLVAGDEARALRHLFFAERRAARPPGLDRGLRPREVGTVGIVGAGTMGGGIAMAFANAGMPVTVLDVDEAALDRGFATIARNYATSVSRGSLARQEADARLSRIARATDYAALTGCELVIEAAFEEMAVKKEVFARLDAVAKPGALLATNTSYLDVDEIASATGRPADVLGLHFFSPANVMKLVEIVRARETAPDAIATALRLAKRISKVPVVVGVCHGFVGNRMLAARSAETEALLLEGASPEQVDRVFTDFGWPMGPFRMADLAGLDIGWRNRKALGETAPVADALCAVGRFGQKTGRGFYRYEEGSRDALPDPDVERLVKEKAAAAGVERRDIPDAEILERTHYPMVNEGARIVEAGIAASASDIDVVWVHGYGFPARRGGPMFWARHVGARRLIDRLRHWHERTGRPVFAPADRLALHLGED